MSAPGTNLETQKSRHKGPLAGIAFVLVFALGLLIALLVWLSANGNTPEATAPQVEVTPGLGATLETEN